nr:MsnO8 family LLM class oxidoreductase [uncultured Pseudomonas sp.]
MRLSVLDQSPILHGEMAPDAIRNTLELAKACDDSGFYRYWIAEHHASPTFAGAAPEALIGALAVATQHLRIGSGGIMLPHYSPYKVAETFSVLASLAPERIDLGVGRGLGGGRLSSLALQRSRDRAPNYGDFIGQVHELVAYFDESVDPPANEGLAALRTTLPYGQVPPKLWLLGSSADSAELAASAGLPYCIADFINPEGRRLAQNYRRLFRPSAILEQPYVAVATMAVAADTDERAQQLALPFIMNMAHLFSGQMIPLSSVAAAREWARKNPALTAPPNRMSIGTAENVKRDLMAVAEEYGAQELLVANIVPEADAQLHSYRLIAQAFDLKKG